MIEFAFSLPFAEYVTDEDWERPTDLKSITDKNATTMFLTEMIRGLIKFSASLLLLFELVAEQSSPFLFFSWWNSISFYIQACNQFPNLIDLVQQSFNHSLLLGFYRTCNDNEPVIQRTCYN